MKILTIVGSPRKNGHSSFIIDRIEEKIKSFANVEFERLYLSDVHLEFCKGCGVCLLNGEENCPSQDDRKMIEDKILASDGVIFISPVYAMNMTAMMKNLMDRTAYTMHRPRFFNQKAMVIAVTGAVGLNETINSLSAIKASGYNIVNSFGIVAPEALKNTKMSDPKILKVIDSNAEKFYKALLSKKMTKVAFGGLIQFRVQQRVFQLHKDKLPCDYAYFSERGWFDKKKKFYIENAKVNFFQNIAAKTLASILLKK